MIGVGSFLGDRYRVERELGRGGMATVYRAHDLKHDRPVAIKVIHPELAAAVGLERFGREIQTIANLQHPHILGLIDSGHAEGAPYYVMPFVDGESLRDRLLRETQLPVAEAVRLAREVASALDYAHRRGVIHRDINPANILLHDGQALVADFGIALAIGSDSETRMTATGISIGTPLYMSPEQATRAREISARSDIYALGALTYEMLLGEPPFTGPTAQAILARVITEKPAALRPRRDTIPAAIEAAVLTALEKLPADRFSTAAEFSEALSDGLAPREAFSRAAAPDRSLRTGRFSLSEDSCRRLRRAAFDPRLIGSEMAYLDNGVSSDVLVCFIAACGRGGDQFASVLPDLRYRGVAPTLRGFEPSDDWRPEFSVEDHIVLVREFVRDLVTRVNPRVTIIAGFSSGADFAIRLAAAPDPDGRLTLHGCLTLGANLSRGTCFLTSALAGLEDNNDDAMLAVLRSVSDRAGSLEEWVNICEYVTHIVPVFRHNPAPLRAFGAGISAPFERESVGPFAEWYRAATARGCRARCVFEDSGMYRELVRELQLRQFDEQLLGDRYEQQSVISEAGTNHFDLIRPTTVARHLDALVRRIG